MPTWRWWLGVTLLCGGLLSALWIRPSLIGDDVLGTLMGVVVTVGFVTGAAVRAMTLLMSARGIRPGCGIAVTIVGFAGMVAVLVLPILL